MISRRSGIALLALGLLVAQALGLTSAVEAWESARYPVITQPLPHHPLARRWLARAPANPELSPPLVAVSPLHLAQQTGATLRLWQPQGETARLEFSLTWDQVPAVLAALRRWPLSITGLLLEPDKTGLRMVVLFSGGGT